MLFKFCYSGYGREICSTDCKMIHEYIYCYKRIGQIQFAFQEDKGCDKKRCTLKPKAKKYLNDTSLQFDFLLKSTAGVFIMRYTIDFTYHNPHDWFDLIIKEVNTTVEKYSTVTEHFPRLYSFFTEIAEICNGIHVLQTANFIGEGIPTWGQTEKNDDAIPQDLSDPEFHHSFIMNMIDELKFVVRDPIHEQNRVDMLLYFIFPTNTTNIDLSLDFRANYEIFSSEDGFDIFWQGNLILTKHIPRYFLSLSAYYESCLIQSKDKVMNGKLILSWIPHSQDKWIHNNHKDLYYLYRDGKEGNVSWEEASSICKTNQSILPILTSKGKQQELIKLVDYLQLPIIFIGLYETEVSNILLCLNNRF